jgi:hypothetical protein
MNIFNYRGFFSIVPFAGSGADGLFTANDAGGFGKTKDGADFEGSNLGNCLELNALHIPQPTNLPEDNDGKTFPY